MNKRAQSVVELMMLLSISILALSIIYALYSSQLDLTNSSKETSIAKSTVNKLINSANSLSLSGAGSSEKVLIQIPPGVSVIDSNINGKMIYFKLSNGTEVFGISDVNLVGGFKKKNGVFVNEGYYINLLFDGQKVILSYDDFELNTNGIFASSKQGTTVEKVFTIRNNSSRNATFWLQNNFSFPNFAVLSMDSSDMQFTLSPNETRVIDFNIALSSFSSGNYAGSINVIGQINDGISDSNISKQVIVSIESFLSLEPVMIFPRTISYSAMSGTSTIKSFSLCNSTESNVSLSWERNSNSDANMLDWFTWPILDTDGIAITNVLSGDCAYFDLNFSIPLSALSNIYDANITITYNDGNTTSTYFFVNVTHSWSIFESLFFSTSNNTLPANYFLSNYVTQRTDTNYIVATGELDWNSSANYNYLSSDYNRDMNGLVGYWKLNDKNSSGWVLNSARGVRDGQLIGGADTNVRGLWDTNAGFFDGNGDYITIPNEFVSVVNIRTNGVSYSAWIKTNNVAVDQRIVGQQISSGYSDYCSGGIGTSSSGKAQMIAYDDSGAYKYATGTTTLQPNRWYYLVGTYNATDGKIRIYVNGIFENSTSIITFSRVYANAANRIGNKNHTTPYDYSGSIEEVKIYSRTLTDSEIILDYNRFLNSKFVDSNIVDAGALADWNSIKINKDVNYNFGKELSLGEKFFDSNLVGLWHLNANGASVDLNDSSGRGNNGSCSNCPTKTTGLWDTNAGSFNGSDAYISIPALTTGAGTGLTGCAWVKRPGALTSLAALFSFPNFRVRFSPGGNIYDRAFNYARGNSSAEYSSIGSVPINQWTFVCVSYSTTGSNITMNFYLNGILDRSILTDLTGYVGFNTSAGCIGADYDYLSRKFTGNIEEPTIWNRTLSQTEISDLYRKGVSRLDLNVYSCSDVNCLTKTSSQYITGVSNNVWTDLSSNLLNSRYLGFDSYFKKAKGFEDYNAGTFYVGSFVNDFNVIYVK